MAVPFGGICMATTTARLEAIIVMMALDAVALVIVAQPARLIGGIVTVHISLNMTSFADIA